jgi:hypothetical protein
MASLEAHSEPQKHGSSLSFEPIEARTEHNPPIHLLHRGNFNKLLDFIGKWQALCHQFNKLIDACSRFADPLRIAEE